MLWVSGVGVQAARALINYLNSWELMTSLQHRFTGTFSSLWCDQTHFHLNPSDHFYCVSCPLWVTFFLMWCLCWLSCSASYRLCEFLFGVRVSHTVWLICHVSALINQVTRSAPCFMLNMFRIHLLQEYFPHINTLVKKTRKEKYNGKTCTRQTLLSQCCKALWTKPSN